MHALRILSSALLLTSLGAIAAACSADPGSGGVDGSCAQYASAYRAYTSKCSTSLGYSDAQWQHLEDRMRAACASALSLPGTGITPGGISVCSNAIRNASCTLDSDDLPECDFPNGTLDDGAACNSNDQCKSGSCNKMNTSCGTCAPRVAIGGDCSVNPRCVENATCNATSKTCVAIVRNGAGGSCDAAKNETCQTGLYCDSATKICKERVAAGQPCTSSINCQSGLSCNATSKTCVAPKLLNEGDTCGTIEARCAAGLTCNAMTMKCQRIVYVAPGGDCSAVGSQCDHGSCDSATKKCPPLLADGAACTTDRTKGVCDDFASCVDGKCQLAGSTVCK